MTSKIKVDNITDQDDNNIINESGDVITVGASGDTVAIAGNIVKSNALQASDGGSIISQSGTTITIGASGDTVSLASGASQSGFGRSGSVDWQTGSIKTSTFTAADGEGYFVDTSSGAVEVDLPAGSAGAIVAINDYASNSATNNITVDSNGSEKIQGSTENHIIQTNGVTVTLVYVDGVQGWKLVDTGEAASFVAEEKFVTATGGTVSTVCTNFKVHVFTGPGTFCVSCGGNSTGNNKVDYLVIAGGGSAGNSGGGGAGGFRESYTPAVSGTYTASPLKNSCGALTVTAQGYPIQVGGGGSPTGTPSIFSTITSTGGGQGGPFYGNNGTAGGSGGGGGGNDTPANSYVTSGGAGNTPPVTPPQGNTGGSGWSGPAPTSGGGAGGGGAGGTGSSAGTKTGGAGGAGATTSISGSPVQRAGGGGGGGTNVPNGSGVPGAAGAGGGGAGSAGGPPGGGNGTANTGGGAGGGGYGGSPVNFGSGGTGGSGIVVIRYKFQ